LQVEISPDPYNLSAFLKFFFTGKAEEAKVNKKLEISGWLATLNPVRLGCSVYCRTESILIEPDTVRTVVGNSVNPIPKAVIIPLPRCAVSRFSPTGSKPFVKERGL
jgi:hypothetical protein